MEDTARMGCFERRWGVPLIDGGTIRLPRLIGLSRALDLIMTGRAVEADEALAMGLANRVVEHGTARQAAEALAAELAEFPQTCMRNDRLSAYEQFPMDMEAALRNELVRGFDSIRSGESTDGSKRFSAGAGRHGRFK